MPDTAPRYKWLPGAARYYDFGTHRFVSSAVVRSWMWRSVATALDPVNDLSDAISMNALSVADWQLAMRQLIKEAVIAQYVLGHGGLATMTQADWGAIGGVCAEQYRWLDGFAADIAAGKLSAKQIAARARMYIRSSQEAFWRATIRATGLPMLPAIPGDGTSRCLCVISPASRVLTARGWIPIIDVKVGDEVWTHRSRWRRVTACIVKPSQSYHRQAIVLSPNGNEVHVTHDHRWFTEAGWCDAVEIDSQSLLMYHYVDNKADMGIGGEHGREDSHTTNIRPTHGRFALAIEEGRQALDLVYLSDGWDATHNLSLPVALDQSAWPNSARSHDTSHRYGCLKRCGRQPGMPLASESRGATWRDTASGSLGSHTGCDLRELRDGLQAPSPGSFQPVLLDAMPGCLPEVALQGESAHLQMRSLRQGVSTTHRQADTAVLLQEMLPRGLQTGQSGASMPEMRQAVRDQNQNGPAAAEVLLNGMFPGGQGASPHLDMRLLWTGISGEPAFGTFRAKILFTELPPGTPLYDIAVEEDHSFVLEGLVAHNTNDKCFWDISPIVRKIGGHKKTVGWDCRWRLRWAKEHCDSEAMVMGRNRTPIPHGCIQRAALWKPLTLWLPGREPEVGYQPGPAPVDTMVAPAAKSYPNLPGAPHRGRPDEVGGSLPRDGVSQESRVSLTLDEAERKLVASRGELLHGTASDFEEFKTGGHGAIYFSDPAENPSRITQAEYIADGSMGGRLRFVTLDRTQLKRFDPLNDPQAKAILEKITRVARPLSFAVEYPDMPALVTAATPYGYNYFRVYEPAVQGFSIAVTNPKVIRTVRLLRKTPAPDVKAASAQKADPLAADFAEFMRQAEAKSAKSGPGRGYWGRPGAPHLGNPGKHGGSKPRAEGTATATTESTGLERVYTDHPVLGRETVGEFLARNRLAVNADGTVTLYHARPKTIQFDELKAGSLFERDPESAAHYAGRDRDLRRDQVEVLEVRVPVDALEPGVFIAVRRALDVRQAKVIAKRDVEAETAAEAERVRRADEENMVRARAARLKIPWHEGMTWDDVTAAKRAASTVGAKGATTAYDPVTGTLVAGSKGKGRGYWAPHTGAPGGRGSRPRGDAPLPEAAPFTPYSSAPNPWGYTDSELATVRKMANGQPPAYGDAMPADIRDALYQEHSNGMMRPADWPLIIIGEDQASRQTLYSLRKWLDLAPPLLKQAIWSIELHKEKGPVYNVKGYGEFNAIGSWSERDGKVNIYEVDTKNLLLGVNDIMSHEAGHAVFEWWNRAAYEGRDRLMEQWRGNPPTWWDDVGPSSWVQMAGHIDEIRAQEPLLAAKLEWDRDSAVKSGIDAYTRAWSEASDWSGATETFAEMTATYCQHIFQGSPFSEQRGELLLQEQAGMQVPHRVAGIKEFFHLALMKTPGRDPGFSLWPEFGLLPPKSIREAAEKTRFTGRGREADRK